MMQTPTAASDAPPTGRERGLRAAAIATAAAAFTWPALVNGFPLLYPDSLLYLWQSKGILGKLRGHDVPYWWYGSMRSEIYSASLAFLHHGAQLWPIVIVQAFLTAWILWLVIRTQNRPRPVAAFLLIAGAIALITPAAWHVSSIMPDILGPLLYLVFFLMVFMAGRLKRWETLLLGLLTVWATTAHATHLLVVGSLCLIFAALWAARWPGMQQRGRQLALVASLVAAAAIAQVAVHWQLYHEASLFGRPPAFLMARLLGDGPARLYLQQHCATSPWLICTHVDHLPTSENEFLWPEDGIWKKASLDQQAELRREQTPLLFATLRAYPMQQAAISFGNFKHLLLAIGPSDFFNYDTFTPHNFDLTVPGLSPRYSVTRQAKNGMPQTLWSKLQLPCMLAALLVALCLLPWAWRSRNVALLSLGLIAGFSVLANAFLSAVISCVDPRLQGRVAWLAVLFASLVAYTYATSRTGTTQPGS